MRANQSDGTLSSGGSGRRKVLLKEPVMDGSGELKRKERLLVERQEGRKAGWRAGAQEARQDRNNMKRIER